MTLQSARYGELHTVADVLDHLNNGGLRHLIQAGIDRANQTFAKTSHMVGDWRVLPNQLSYQVNLHLLLSFGSDLADICYRSIILLDNSSSILSGKGQTALNFPLFLWMTAR